jgi:hypothetical protein
MKAAGLSHSKASDEITPADKLAILKSLKERKTQPLLLLHLHQIAGELQLNQKAHFLNHLVLLPLVHQRVLQIILRLKDRLLQKI